MLLIESSSAKPRIKNVTFATVGHHLCCLDSKQGSDVTLDKAVRHGSQVFHEAFCPIIAGNAVKVTLLEEVV